MKLSEKMFSVPDYGTVSGDNAVFVQFLRPPLLSYAYSQPIELDDLAINQTAWASFQSGAGWTRVLITRVS